MGIRLIEPVANDSPVSHVNDPSIREILTNLSTLMPLFHVSF